MCFHLANFDTENEPLCPDQTLGEVAQGVSLKIPALKPALTLSRAISLRARGLIGLSPEVLANLIHSVIFYCFEMS